MPIVVEKKGEWRGQLSLFVLLCQAKWPFMEAGRPSPLKVQISQDGEYKPGFLEAVKKRFVEIGGHLKT
jgi:hypothetical protein